jgi:arylsulfatase A-like enzyme
MSPMARAAMLSCCLVLGAAAGCERTPEGPQRNILFIVVDTLRWDHVGSYGASRRKISPAMDALSRESVRFHRAYATAPWTRPSIGSMITGLHPSSHGGTAVDQPLPDEAHTLAEILSESGYATHAVISNWVISKQNGFAQGYTRYHESIAALHHKSTSERVSDVAEKALGSLAAGQSPFLLFVHYFDPHYRYLPHSEVGWSGGELGRIAEKPSVFEVRAMGDSLSEEEIANLRDLYAEEVRHTDTQVGRLLGALDKLGLQGDTVVVLVSDHGEEIFERGYLGHAHSLHEELLRVPFIVRAPGLARQVVDTPVSLVSITPTLLDLAGVEYDADAFQGHSLRSLMEGDDEAAKGAFLFAEVDYLPDKRVERTAHERGIIGRRFKLIRDQESGELELYDLERDPGEMHDLAEARPKLAARLLMILERQIERAESGSSSGPPRALSEQDRRQLEELGYLEPES